MRVRRLVLAAAVVGASFALPMLPASACVPPNCPGFGHCEINRDWEPPSTRLIECYY